MSLLTGRHIQERRLLQKVISASIDTQQRHTTETHNRDTQGQQRTPLQYKFVAGREDKKQFVIVSFSHFTIIQGVQGANFAFTFSAFQSY